MPFLVGTIVLLVILAAAGLAAAAGVALCLLAAVPPEGVISPKHGGGPAAVPPEGVISPKHGGEFPAVFEGMKVARNKKIEVIAKSSIYIDEIGGVPELRAVEDLIRSGKCAPGPTLYARTRPGGRVGGYHVRILPAGEHLYKAVPGFISAEGSDQYMRKNPDTPFWFGDKYITWAIVREAWTGLVSFFIEKDLVLFDYFNKENLSRLVEELGPAEEELIKEIRLMTGLGITEEEQARALTQRRPEWEDLWYYTHPVYPSHTYLPCDIEKPSGLWPITGIGGVAHVDRMIFSKVLSKHPGIDGIARPSAHSRFDFGGITFTEEFVLKGSAVYNNMKFDTKDPICWVNWKFKNFTPVPDLQLRREKWKLNMQSPPNYNFAKFRFIQDNRSDPQPPPDLVGETIIAYNVHGFNSLDASETDASTKKKIAELLRRYRATTTFLVLTEVPGDSGYEDLLADAGYPHQTSAPNGSRKPWLKIVLASSDPLGDTTVIVTDPPAAINRKQILFATRGLKGVGLHLEIGKRPFSGDEDVNKKARAGNSKIRIRELEQILEHDPDFLVGDFNFTLEDPEAAFLGERGYLPVNTGDQKSTPYNRVDHFFVREKLLPQFPPESNRLISCNYTDHLPMLQLLPE